MEQFIWNVPKWKGKIVFDYETMVFVLTIAVLVAGMLLCVFGCRYLSMMCMLAVCCFLGAAGLVIAERVTSNEVFKMSLFVIFTFFGACVVYCLSVLINYILRRVDLSEPIAKKSYLIAAVLGAGLVCADVYLYIYRNAVAAGLLFVLLAAGSAWYGKRRTDEARPFYTYDDLILLQPRGNAKEDRND